jgi:hypothetical protein
VLQNVKFLNFKRGGICYYHYVLTVNEYATCVFQTYLLTLKLQICGPPYLRFYYTLTLPFEYHKFNRLALYYHLGSDIFIETQTSNSWVSISTVLLHFNFIFRVPQI